MRIRVIDVILNFQQGTADVSLLVLELDMP